MASGCSSAATTACVPSLGCFRPIFFKCSHKTCRALMLSPEVNASQIGALRKKGKFTQSCMDARFCGPAAGSPCRLSRLERRIPKACSFSSESPKAMRACSASASSRDPQSLPRSEAMTSVRSVIPRARRYKVRRKAANAETKLSQNGLLQWKQTIWILAYNAEKITSINSMRVYIISLFLKKGSTYN